MVAIYGGKLNVGPSLPIEKHLLRYFSLSDLSELIREKDTCRLVDLFAESGGKAVAAWAEVIVETLSIYIA